MNRLVVRTALLALATVFVAHVGHARADYIYFDCQSQITPGDFSSSISGLNFQGSVRESHASARAWNAPLLLITAATWQRPSAGSVGAGPFDPHPVSITFTLTDDASGAEGSLVYSGTFDAGTPQGTLSVTNPGPRSLVLGNNRYTLSGFKQDTFVETQMVGQGTAQFYISALNVFTAVAPLNSPAPEPASLTLAGLGLAMALGGGLYQRRRRG
jgi:MYXO-CTERM domain-containing protein